MPAAVADSAPDAGSESGAATRHQQRERALSLLYEAELKGETPLAVLAALAVRPDPYVCTLLQGAEDTRAEADRRITAASVGWPLDRMAVIIDEAVELVKTYSTDDSGSFVNGILSTIAADVRPG